MATTRTINPLHFEDLEPHRFEDLVRQLMYDFRDWHKIEATGRGGSDDGIDIRAWEKTKEVDNTTDTVDENEEKGGRVIEQNLWIIQCKRENTIGPGKVKSIVQGGVSKDDPPHGYILVAPANFSKKSYDIFREELLKKGVSEFYLWGRATLEDMLYMPKNDRILFTFFGLSLATKKRSRSTEIRFIMNNKNKLMKILGEDQNHYESMLIRDYNDDKYPYENQYSDFDKFPRWQEHIALGLHPEGLRMLYRKHYTYVDQKNKTFDFFEKEDLVNRRTDHDKYDVEAQAKISVENQQTKDYWLHLPHENQAYLFTEGLIRYEDMLVIDREGDTQHKYPHIFVDFRGKNHPFKGFWQYLKRGNNDFEPRIYLDNYQRSKIFPDTIPKIQQGKIYKDKNIEWSPDVIDSFKRDDNMYHLFDVDNKYDFLEPRDVILVTKGEKNYDTYYLEITRKTKTTVKKYLDPISPSFTRGIIERQVGRKINDSDKLIIFEFIKRYGFQIDK